MNTTLISNPPYNIKWKHPPFAQIQPRFYNCELPPENNANYAFILTALEKADRVVLLLPCGILTTDNKQEKEIRKYLTEKNIIEAIIMCPDKMFEATSIPTCILVLDKNKKTLTTEMLDMRHKFEIEIREQNGQYGGPAYEGRTYKKEIKVFTDEITNDALRCITERKNNEYCKAVSAEDIKKEDYILTPSRYIEVKNETTHRMYGDIVKDLNRVIKEKNTCKLTINETLAKTLGLNIDLFNKNENFEDLNKLIEKLTGEKIAKADYFRTTKCKNEIKFENNSKENISSIFMIIFNMWKQHIYYLNDEENRYLMELRDALLPGLMSGEIEMQLGI